MTKKLKPPSMLPKRKSSSRRLDVVKTKSDQDNEENLEYYSNLWIQRCFFILNCSFISDYMTCISRLPRNPK